MTCLINATTHIIELSKWGQVISTIKIVGQVHKLTIMSKITIKILHLKSVIILDNENVTIFLQKTTPEVGEKKVFYAKNSKILFHGHM